MPDAWTLQTVPLELSPHALVFEASGDVRLATDGSFLLGDVGSAVRLNGVFASFAESYWRRHTQVRTVDFALTLAGRVLLRIVRRDLVRGIEHCIFAHVFKAPTPRTVRVPIDFAQHGEALLWVELVFQDTTSVSDLRWQCDTPPVQDTVLAGVVCTFNRDADVIANLTALQQSACRPFDYLVLVNQGEAGLRGRLDRAGLVPDGVVLQVIEQANLGGAGGFVRGIMAALAGPATHVVLMDDDIMLEPVVLQRIRAIYRHASSDMCIGGAMFDLFDRTRLFSAGDMLHPARHDILNLRDPHTDNASDQATRDFVARYRVPDFNAWWCFAVPRTVIEAHGLPLPLFIRGDDIEFGYRLTRAGVPTLCWPGVAVWHRPFGHRLHAWHCFYNQRNSLFLCEMHGRFGRLRMAGMICGSFFSHLLRYDYARAAMIARGLAAFNRGVDGLLAWSATDHANLLKVQPLEFRAAGRPLPLRTVQMKPAPDKRPRGHMLRQVSVDLFLPLCKLGRRFGFIRQAHLSPFSHPRPRIMLIRRANTRLLEVRRYRALHGWLLTLALLCHLSTFLLIRRFRPDRLRQATTHAAWQAYLRRHR